MHMVTRARRWTLAEVHSLPDDGNKYELIHGELYVTPAPSTDHETILARHTGSSMARSARSPSSSPARATTS
ncbi:MAG TPA: hypothetical protein VH277_17000 [Gemmatimonadaceae bacterium]|nr:hypothetical protein [Gemmatimonadaceae bacterium]